MNCSPFYLTALAQGVGHLPQRGNRGQGRRTGFRKTSPRRLEPTEGPSPEGTRRDLIHLLFSGEKQDKGRWTWMKVKNFNSGIRNVDPAFAICGL